MSGIPEYIPPASKGGASEEWVKKEIKKSLVNYFPSTGGSVSGDVIVGGASSTTKFVIQDEEGNNGFIVSTDKGCEVTVNGAIFTSNNTLDNGAGNVDVAGSITTNGLTTTSLTVSGDLHLNDVVINGYISATAKEDTTPYVATWQTYLGDIIAQARTDGSFLTNKNTIDDGDGNTQIYGSLKVKQDAEATYGLLAQSASNNPALYTNNLNVHTYNNLLDDGDGNVYIA